MSSAEAPSAAVRTMIPPSLASSPLMISFSRARSRVVEPARDSEALALRDEDEEASGQRDLRRQPRALRLHRVLDRLDEDLLAARDQVGDLLAVALALELGDDDLVDVEEAVLLEADLDECGLHPGQDVVDGAEVDVAGDRALVRPLEVDLGDAVVLDDRDALLADVDRDQELALGLGQRRSLLRHAAAVSLLVGAAFLPLAALARLAALRLRLALRLLGLLGAAALLGRRLSRARRAGLLPAASAAVTPAALLRRTGIRVAARAAVRGGRGRNRGYRLRRCLLHWSGRRFGCLLLLLLALPSKPG